MVLVTGGSGFIGNRLINALKDDVRVVSRKKQPNHETVIVDFESENISKKHLLGINTIFHLSGLSHDIRDPDKIKELYHRVNVRATIELAMLAVSSGVTNFIFISSTKAGGRPSYGECANEKSKNVPEGVYGSTKREAEIELLKIGKDSSMCVSIIRPSLVYGPNVKGNLKLMLSGIAKGWFPPLPETFNKRSMIHVDDLVEAILFVSKNKKAKGEIFIATDGVHYSSRKIYEYMCIVSGKSIPKWSVPKFVFNMLSIMSPTIKYKVDKLLGNECYSSEKLKSLGFIPKRTLMEMNETSF